MYHACINECHEIHVRYIKKDLFDQKLKKGDNNEIYVNLRRTWVICTVIRSTRKKYKLHFKLHCKLHLHLQTSVEMDIITQRHTQHALL